MNARRCVRPGCGALATASLTYHYASRTAWLDDLDDEAHPAGYDLCAQHADRSNLSFTQIARGLMRGRLLGDSKDLDPRADNIGDIHGTLLRQTLMGC